MGPLMKCQGTQWTLFFFEENGRPVEDSFFENEDILMWSNKCWKMVFHGWKMILAVFRGCGESRAKRQIFFNVLEFLKHNMFWEEDSSIQQDKPIVFFSIST